jgi:ubiquinol-cytochrome c reductase cytochrome b subunit
MTMDRITTNGAEGGKADRDHHGDEVSTPFFPDFILLEALTALVALVVLLVLASMTDPELDATADPSASGYIPRPEWYFLWVFQILRYFKGEMEILGTFVVPALFVGFLAVLPFLDRREAHPRPLLPRTRPVRLWPRMVGAGLMTVIGALTLMGMNTHIPVTAEPELTDIQAVGAALYDKMGCSSCHAIAGEGGTRGPDLTDFGSRADARERVLLHFGSVAADPESIMPGYELSTEELRALAEYLLSLKAT